MSLDKRSLAVISASPNNLEVFGITNDKTSLGQISFNGSTWSTWSLLGLSDGLFFKSAPSAVSPHPGSFDVFATDTSDKLLTRHFNDTSWRPYIGWQLMQDKITDAGNPVALGPHWGLESDRYNLYTRDLDGEALLIYNFEDSPRKFGTAYGRDLVKGSPIEVTTGLGTKEIVQVGLDDHFFHCHWNGDWYLHKQIIGEQKFISSPTVLTNAPGRVDVFGIAPDQTVMHNSYQNSSDEWTGWEQLGTLRFASSISAVVPQGNNQIELWGLGLDGALWHRYGNGSHWPVDWDSHKGSFISAPALISSSQGVYDVFAIGTDRQVKHARHIQTTDTWKPAYQTWNSLGGDMHGFN